MMKSYVLFALVCLMFLTACQKSSPNSPKEADVDEVLLTTVSIDASGGALESENFTLTIPPGALISAAEMKLYAVGGENLADQVITQQFRVEGFPVNYQTPLTLSLKHQGSLSGESFIAFSSVPYIRSLDNTTQALQLLPATGGAGSLICNIPIPEGVVAESGAAFKTRGAAQDENSALFQALTGVAPFTTSGGHFRITTAARNVNVSSVQQLGNALESAYTYVRDSLGFRYSARTEWPVAVTVRKLDSQVYGYYSDSMLGDNYGTMEFNSEKIDEIVQMNITAAHEFLHLVQSLYDPRNRLTKAKGWFYDHHWMDEATAVWIEEKFSGQPGYVSPIRGGHEMAPMNGMQKGAEDNAGYHGYGMSSVIKYLEAAHGKNIIYQIYQEIKADYKPVDAIQSAYEDPVLWYEDFLRMYVLGQIYNMPLATWVGNVEDVFRIQTEDDTLKSFTASYADLSAKIYKVGLEYPDIDSSASIRFKATGGTNEVTAFKYKSSGIEFIDNYNEEIKVEDIRVLTEQGYHLLVLVTNSRSVSPYTDEQSITLDIEVIEESKVESIWFDLDVKGKFKRTYLNDPDRIEDRSWNLWEVSVLENGEIEENRFTAVWDTSYDDGLYEQGSLIAEFNADRSMVTSLVATERFGFPQGHLLYYITQYTVTVENIPFHANYGAYAHYKVDGDVTCGKITGLMLNTLDNYTYDLLTGYQCEEDSYIDIQFWFEDITDDAAALSKRGDTRHRRR